MIRQSKSYYQTKTTLDKADRFVLTGCALAALALSVVMSIWG